MSLVQILARMVGEQGRADANRLTSELEGYSRKQVIRGLQNAAARDLIHCIGRSQEVGKHGKAVGVYAPGPKPKRKQMPAPRRTASVWEYAQHG